MTGNRGIIDKYLCNSDPELTLIYNEMRVLEPLITADMQQLSSSLGTGFAGTEFSVKTASSVEDKLQRAENEIQQDQSLIGHRFDPRSTLYALKDVIRYTEVCEHDTIMSVAKSTISELEDKGYTLSGIRNYYTAPYPDTGYQGLHLNFITPYGQEIELQVHSQESFEAKQAGHKLYEQIRSVSTLESDKEAMKMQINQVHSSIPKPQGYESLPVKYDLPDKDKIISERRARVDVDINMTSLEMRPNVMTYAVAMDDQVLLTGFESIFSDGSARSYQNNMRDGFAKYGSINKDGVEIATHEAPQRDVTMEYAMEITAQSEYKHVQWMELNFSAHEREGLEDIIHLSPELIDRDQETVISAIEHEIE
jgi:hypothetical protein